MSPGLKLPPRPNTYAAQVVPQPDLLQPESNDSPGRASLLYRIYLVVLLGGIYGVALVQAILDTPTLPFTDNELVIAGVAAIALPLVAIAIGAGVGAQIGVVPITRAEAEVLLPTQIDRRQIVLPRFARTLLIVTIAGTAAALVSTALLALQRAVGGGAWVMLPLLGASAAALGVAVAARSQSRRGGRRERQRRYAYWFALVIVVLGAAVGPGRVGFAFLGNSVLGLDGQRAALILLVTVAASAVVAVFAGRAGLVNAHTEDLASHAGMHGGVAVSASLGSVRSIVALGESNSRRRRRSWPYPRRPTGVVRWRYLTALRARPAPLLMCLGGWSLATWLLTLSTSGPADVVFHVFMAAAAVYVGTAPLLEPLRREHDTPMASELFPFGFARLTRLHQQSALLVTTPVGLVGVSATWALTERSLPTLPVITSALATAITIVIALGDRMRKTTSLGAVIASLPIGATPEVLGMTLAAKLLWPLTSLLPVALPVGVMLAAPYLDISAAPLAIGTAVVGVAMLTGRALGLAAWLNEYERTLRNADVLEPSGSFTLIWRRLQDLRDMRRHR